VDVKVVELKTLDVTMYP